MNKKYENQELVDKIDAIATKILKEKHHNCYRDHFFPLMINALDLKIGVEIGVDKAGFSERVLSQTKMSQYICVDTWQDNFGSDYKPGYYDKDGNIRYDAARAILKPYIDKHTAVMVRTTSVEAAKITDNNSIDFCYIDGDHSLFGIYDDLFAWAPKVKIGGIIAGHDYKDGPKSGINDFWGEQLDYKIKTVVDDYCLKFGHKLYVTGGLIRSWWFIKNR
jgi:hypothetical protein